MRGVRSLVSVTIAIVFLGAVAAQGAIIAHDGFGGYAAGSLGGNNGGTGWGGAWQPASSTATVVTSGLSANGIDGGNRAIGFSGADNPKTAYRSLATSFTGDAFYVSFLVDFGSGAINNNDFLVMWLSGPTVPADTATANIPNIGLKANKGDGSGPQDYFVRIFGTNVNDGAWAGEVAVVGTTVQIVGKLSKSSATGDYERFDLWVNPTGPGDAIDATIIDSAGGLESINWIGFRQANLDAGDQILVDEIVLSDTFPVPEPASLAVWTLLGAAGAAAAVRSRKRRGWTAENRDAIIDVIRRS